MTIEEAILHRHSVRAYLDKPIEEEKKDLLAKEVEKVNKESGLHVQLFTDEPKCFNVSKPGYGIFKDCKNYFVMVGKKGNDEKIGYYGQHLVLFAQMLGLNTCWAALSYKKGAIQPELKKGEKVYIVIALGYGETQGNERKIKPLAELGNVTEDSPEWFIEGLEAASLAPTAINQQKFYLTQNGNKVSAKAKLSFYSVMDLGIVKYNFEIGAGKENFSWE